MKQNLPYLRHILHQIDLLLENTNDVTYEDFMSDEFFRNGCIRGLEVIGEAVKNLSSDLRKNHKDVDWKRIAGMRDKLIHFYFGVNYDIIWQVIKDRLPDLREKIQAIIRELEETEI